MKLVSEPTPGGISAEIHLRFNGFYAGYENLEELKLADTRRLSGKKRDRGRRDGPASPAASTEGGDGDGTSGPSSRFHGGAQQ